MVPKTSYSVTLESVMLILTIEKKAFILYLAMEIKSKYYIKVYRFFRLFLVDPFYHRFYSTSFNKKNIINLI